MGLDEPSFKQQTDGRSVGRRKEEADKKRSFVIWMKKGGTIKKGGHHTQQQRPGCADWPSILSQKKKKLRNDAPCKKEEPNPFEVMSPHVVGSQERQTSSRGSFKQKWPPMGSIEKIYNFFWKLPKKVRVCVKTKKNRKIRREKR
jgi:hypothetical protein